MWSSGGSRPGRKPSRNRAGGAKGSGEFCGEMISFIFPCNALQIPAGRPAPCDLSFVEKVSYPDGMRKILPLAVACVVWAGAARAEAPRGEYLELHSCEVYTGGCTASAQAQTGGRTMLRVWHFDGKTDWAGQTLAVLETAEENLAFKETQAVARVAYLPETASQDQQAAMVAWLKEKGLAPSEFRAVPVSYQRSGSQVEVAAGPGVLFKTRAIEACDSGACGEQLWYSPRGETAAYTVLVNEHSSVEEPALRLAWKDHAAKSVFFGRFGEPGAAEFTLASLP